MPNYRNRIDKIIGFVNSDYPQYAPDLIVELTPAQKEHKRLFHKSTHDLRYNRLHPNIVKVFMSGFKKKRADGKHYQWDHNRKYHNAICKCAENVGQQLPLNYKSEIKAHLALLKKENTSARSKGQLDEKDADPIDFELYKHICEWSIKDRDVFSWAFT